MIYLANMVFFHRNLKIPEGNTWNPMKSSIKIIDGGKKRQRVSHSSLPKASPHGIGHFGEFRHSWTRKYVKKPFLSNGTPLLMVITPFSWFYTPQFFECFRKLVKLVQLILILFSVYTSHVFNVDIMIIQGYVPSKLSETYGVSSDADRLPSLARIEGHSNELNHLRVHQELSGFSGQKSARRNSPGDWRSFHSARIYV